MSETASRNVERIARVAHEANAALCRAFGDKSQVSWEKAEPWQRSSAEAGVRFRMANRAAPASTQHEAWMADKLQDGWVYGPVKDPEAKTHPCLVPFSELPPHQQAKDELFTAIVLAMLSER